VSVLFTNAQDIRTTLQPCRVTGIQRTKRVGGTLDTLDRALAEIRALLADGRRWDCGQLYRHSPSAQQRWPQGSKQGRKAIERHLDSHGDTWGVVRCSTGIWRVISA
jgi:hypothetical protein